MQVHTTNDYALFSSIEGNRQINELHLKHLKKSIEEKMLFTVITVNEKYQIIDGQHRFYVLKELGLPVNYVICEGYGLNEVHRLNNNSKTWGLGDYLDGYCNLGYQDYVIFKKFKKTYKFGNDICIALLSGKMDFSRSNKDFTQGKFKISDLSWSQHIAGEITKIGHYYEGYKRKSFIVALLKLFKNKNFDMDTFLKKLKTQPASLKHCANANDYLDLIEKIYNFRSSNKVSLKY